MLQPFVLPTPRGPRCILQGPPNSPEPHHDPTLHITCERGELAAFLTPHTADALAHLRALDSTPDNWFKGGLMIAASRIQRIVPQLRAAGFTVVIEGDR